MKLPQKTAFSFCYFHGNPMNTVSVIIATTCETSRRSALLNAIDSVLSQKNVDTNVIAVVNGNRINMACLEQLRNTPRVEVVQQTKGSYPQAIRTGRSRVEAPFFAFLDDDDEYLPGAVERRIAPLLADPTLAFIASNGVRRLRGKDYTVVKMPDAVRTNPLCALARGNWLASCGGLFRTSSVGIEYFDGETAHLEWTYLAYQLALTRSMVFVDEPTFVINDSPDSLSKSDAYARAAAQVLPKILMLDLPEPVHRDVREKLGHALHDIAGRESAGGNWWRAWKYHIASLFCPNGLQYLLYSRKLIFPVKRPAPGALLPPLMDDEQLFAENQ